jgi:hypothetical protein
MTVHGTQPLRPFSDHPCAVGSVFIVDPLFTLPLLAGPAVAPRRDGHRGLGRNAAGLLLGTAYLAWGWSVQQHARAVAERALAEQGIAAERVPVTATPLDTVLWRVVAVTSDGFHEGFRSLLDREPGIRVDRGTALRDAVVSVDVLAPGPAAPCRRSRTGHPARRSKLTVMSAPTPRRRDNGNPLIEVLVSIVLPAVILMKFSGAQHLGALPALLVALAFPLGWGLVDLVRRRRFGLVPALGIVSTLLTGGIGLLALDARWLAIKEAAVPGLIGLAVLISSRTRWPLIRMLVYNRQVLDVDKVDAQLAARGTVPAFEARLRSGTLLLAGTFFFSSAMNYALARWIVTSPAGTEAFNAELGRLTLLSYPLIALPSMAMTIGIVVYLARGAKRLTGLTVTEMLHHR